jgi:hypothetical protein
MVKGLLSLTLVVACGSGAADGASGIDGTKLVVELSADELDTVCEYIARISGPERSFMCGSTPVKGGITKERCISNAPTATNEPSCSLTVEQLETCYEFAAMYRDDPCDIPPNDACNPLAASACN